MGIHHLLDKKDMGWSLYGVEPQYILSIPSTPFPSPKTFIFSDKYHQVPCDRKAAKDNYLHALCSFNKQLQNTRTLVHIMKMKLSDRWCNSLH